MNCTLERMIEGSRGQFCFFSVSSSPLPSVPVFASYLWVFFPGFFIFIAIVRNRTISERIKSVGTSVHVQSEMQDDSWL